ncbi:tryptophan synthase beta subunit-like PLP-dependent enzyme [Cokeromyces recurvatus]|uniref:tryptophan synthase beta subunit-like PLP-dependent enzyme n=1 Tax=Cokeromyces recurvatus TaxID=90255 RepID=UPI0022200D70|nr:tryptophan synthase beta subunit-like PLP-dependent enzyme [Cokeromyces recurvatus]KAI7908070.1 tryptophan synthase beta subunit-like PLP-dependent enzyme [Cokeromyces recurvatus]
MVSEEISINHVLQAAERIQVHRTPIATSTAMNELVSKNGGIMSSVELFFKCELFQKTGSFKYRGASNAIALLTDEEAANGVVCHSSGNHAQALALAAKNRGIPAYIVMPKNSPKVKKEAVYEYGAQIIECEPFQSERESMAEKVRVEKQASFIHPFNNPNVIAGQGTIVIELFSQVSDLDAILVPVGGGGMLTGCSIAAKALNPKIKVFAAEPSQVDDCYRTFKGKKRMTNSVKTESVADGLLTNLGDIAYHEVLKHVDDVFTVSEKEIIQAMELIWERMKLCIEPSAAVGCAVALYNQDFHEKIKQEGIKRIGIILCGGNVDIIKATELFQKYK